MFNHFGGQYRLNGSAVNMFDKVLVFMLSVGVQGRYTGYSPTTRTYDLQVPGSRPIRIIEAEPQWDSTSNDVTTEKLVNGIEHRDEYDEDGQPSTTMVTKVTINNPVDQFEHTTEDSALALKEFLKRYAEKVKQKQMQDESGDLENVHLITRDEDEARNKLGTFLLYIILFCNIIFPCFCHLKN